MFKPGDKATVLVGDDKGRVVTITKHIGDRDGWNYVDFGDGSKPSGYFDNELEAVSNESLP